MTIAPDLTSFFNLLEPGDPTAKFAQRTLSTPSFGIDTLAGRYIVFCFFGSAATAQGQGAITAIWKNRKTFDDRRMSFFGVSVDPEDETKGRISESIPGIRFILDFDASVSRQCGAVSQDNHPQHGNIYRQFWLVVDPTLHVLRTFDFDESGIEHDKVFTFLRQLPAPSAITSFNIPAPILILPNVFEPELCRILIELYEQRGGHETGVMRNDVAVIDRSMKSRADCIVIEPTLIKRLQKRIYRKIVPEIERVFFMKITRMERYLVGCYASEQGGHFQPHRDNRQPVTAHRRFAVSINLNNEFDGGEVSFPEYNSMGYKAPPGWAIVFPCNLLHAVSRVKKGKRYAFLPFIFDEAGELVRLRNLQSLPK